MSCFLKNNVGIVTSKDAILINENRQTLIKNIESFYHIEAEINLIKRISYRPFDNKFVYYDVKLLERARESIMQNFLKGNNCGLVVARQCVGDWQYVFCTKFINEFNLTGTAGRFGAGNTFPLYTYTKAIQSTIFNVNEDAEFYGDKQISYDSSILSEPQFAYRNLAYRPNLSQKIVRAIEKSLGILFIIQKFKTSNDEFGEVDILDYVYAVLHSPTYREKYKEFLKIDFPRVPYPKDKETFWMLVKLGGEIRQIHLLESPIVEKYITQYPIGGNNEVSKPKYIPIPKNETTGQLQGNVYINDGQYFANVPLTAWSFYIGGYQPAQKWLKDRKDRTLEFDDILHYQKIIVALLETDRLMKEIDKIEIE